MCHRKIRNGQKFCDSCKQKRKNKADESYLDSLLTSVGVKTEPVKEESPIEDYYEEGNPSEGYYDTQGLQDTDIPYGGELNVAEAFKDYSSTPGSNVPPANYVLPSSNLKDTAPEPANNYVMDTTPEPEKGYNMDAAQEPGTMDMGIAPGTEDMQGAENVHVDDNMSGMDDMISDLLDDMDSADIEPQSEEPAIEEADLENIFDEAEAYATLLGKDEPQPQPQPEENADEMFDVSSWGSGEPDDQQPQEGLTDVEWNNNNGSAFDNDVDALFEEVDANIGKAGGELPVDEQLNSVDESLFGENTEKISVNQAFSDFDPIEESISVTPKKKKKKKLSWFKRLFGNTNDEVTPDMIEADRVKKEEEARQEQLNREEKKKIAEKKKAEAEAEKARKKAEADAERNRKMALAAEKKAAEKEKARKKKETALAIAEYEMEHGKINKAGATILFVIFAILTIVIIIGTNIYSYNLSFENAQKDFDVRKYNEAYYEVYGYDPYTEIKEDDILLYDRIMTVMFVNTQLNSYEYYMKSNNREKALDSLLKGLQRYDKFFQLAQNLNITDDLDYVKDKILVKLSTEFNLSEEDAYKMMSIEETVDYSEYLYGLLGSYEEELEKYR